MSRCLFTNDQFVTQTHVTREESKNRVMINILRMFFFLWKTNWLFAVSGKKAEGVFEVRI